MEPEAIVYNGIKYALVIRSGVNVNKTTFFSPPDSSFQFGLLARPAGFQEEPHTHKSISRTIHDLQQMFVVQRGVVAVDLFSYEGTKIREILLYAGDAIVLIEGPHAIHVVEDMQCISVKQGPFMGDEADKLVIKE